MKNQKKTIFSGIKPSGSLHLGNYLGAISQWLELQKEYNCIFCVVDYHAITVAQNPIELQKSIIDIAKVYLAAGLDPKKNIIFQQSDLSEHTELAWILNTVARMSELNKMTQYKDKAFGKKEENIGVGLFDYPVLMASDILIYDTNLVPVGDDQLQHVELARELARRFNKNFGETFIIPEAKVKKESARIMGLDDPQKKMSKSAGSEYNYIALNEDLEKAKKKIMRAVTDSGEGIVYDLENKPAISNLLTIYSLLSKKSISELESQYVGKGYGDFKRDLADVVVSFLSDFQSRYNKISDAKVKKILSRGAKRARTLAQKKLKVVKRNIGVN
jgi:tryptophanyl-tRNA synthetase